MTQELPEDVTKLIDQPLYEETGDFPVERGYIWTACASVENGNPLYWDENAAGSLTGGPIAPPSMLSTWFRPHSWAPDQAEPKMPLQVHFDLKARLGLPEAIISEFTTVFHEPLRPGDVVSTCQRLRSISPPKTTKLGVGRFWTIDVEYRNQRGDLCGVESYTGFGYANNGLSGYANNGLSGYANNGLSGYRREEAEAS